MKPMKKIAKKGAARPVLVTTQHRGVFFGYATDTTGDTVHLDRARMCVYWSADMKGVLGLASDGPSPSCRVSPAVELDLRDVTAVAEVTPEAVKKWEMSPWCSGSGYGSGDGYGYGYGYGSGSGYGSQDISK